jgi:hypothetical protein
MVSITARREAVEWLRQTQHELARACDVVGLSTAFGGTALSQRGQSVAKERPPSTHASAANFILNCLF